MLRGTFSRHTIGLILQRRISAASLWRIGGYTVPQEPHAVEELLEDVRAGMEVARKGGHASEASTLLERAHQISGPAFGATSEAALHVHHMLALSLFNAERFAVAEKHLRELLKVVDEQSPIDRFELRVMRADALRRLERLDEAVAACVVEESDSVEQQVEMLTRQAWLETQRGEQGTHQLNEAAALSDKLEAKSQSLAQYSSMILCMQALVSAGAGQWEEGVERAERAAKTISQWRELSGNKNGLNGAMGDAFTAQGKALIAGKSWLRAEERLDSALAEYGDDSARAAEALLALGGLFRATSSMTYAEGTYRKLLAAIDRHPEMVGREHIRQTYDEYAWFLRNHRRTPEAEEVEQEYIRLFHNKT